MTLKLAPFGSVLAFQHLHDRRLLRKRSTEHLWHFCQEVRRLWHLCDAALDCLAGDGAGFDPIAPVSAVVLVQARMQSVRAIAYGYGSVQAWTTANAFRSSLALHLTRMGRYPGLICFRPLALNSNSLIRPPILKPEEENEPQMNADGR